MLKKIKALLYKEKYAAILLAGPGVLWLLFFVIVPFISALVLSLTNRTLVENPKIGTSFIGLKNYIELFQDKEFFQALGNNMEFTLLAVPIQCGLALLLAILLNNKLKGIGFFRTIYFVPILVPMLVVAMTWSLLFTPNAGGFINSLLSSISFGKIEPLKWLFDAKIAMKSIVIFSVWAGVGFQTVIILSGLQSVDVSLYEAASVDGAKMFQKFWNITIPELRNTLIFVFLSSTVMSFKLFTQVMVLTQGGPRGATNTLVYMIYDTGFIDQRLGYSSAISVVFFLIVLAISLIQQKATKMTSK